MTKSSRPEELSWLDDYNHAVREASLLARPERSVLTVTGRDRTRFLQAMLSNDVKRLPAGRVLPACLLDAKGRVLGVMTVCNAGEEFWIETDRSVAENVLAILERHIIADDVAVEIRSGVAVWSLLGPALSGLGLPFGEFREYRFGTIGCRLATLAVPIDPTWQIYVPTGGRFEEEVRSALPAVQRIGREAFEALRIEAGQPVAGTDFSGENLLPEIPFLERCVSYTKGCFLGQETLARVQARGGKIARRMMGLAVVGGGSAEAGDPVWAANEEVSRLTSVCESPKLGCRLGLAVLPRSLFAPGTGLEVGPSGRKVPATVIALPL